MIDEKKLIEEIEKLDLHGRMREYAGLCAAVDIIKNQPKVGEWIPCSERLPEVEDLHEISIEDSTCYLIQRRCGVMNVAHYIKAYGESYFEAHCIKFNDVIAWQPRPEPYKPGMVRKQTNADRIRAMSDEELAELLDSVDNGGIRALDVVYPCDECTQKTECEDCFKEWLQSEVEVSDEQ